MILALHKFYVLFSAVLLVTLCNPHTISAEVHCAILHFENCYLSRHL